MPSVNLVQAAVLSAPATEHKPTLAVTYNDGESNRLDTGNASEPNSQPIVIGRQCHDVNSTFRLLVALQGGSVPGPSSGALIARQLDETQQVNPVLSRYCSPLVAQRDQLSRISFGQR